MKQKRYTEEQIRHLELFKEMDQYRPDITLLFHEATSFLMISTSEAAKSTSSIRISGPFLQDRRISFTDFTEIVSSRWMRSRKASSTPVSVSRAAK